jgi:AcrR family transcriptional regulator
VTKAAVLYHFDSKNAVVRSAYESVIGALTAIVGERIAAAPTPAAAVDAYLTALVRYMADNPTHVRVIVEALDRDNATGIGDSPQPTERWKGLADLIDAAVASGAYRSDVDSRVLALILNGAVDGLVAESLADPAFDLTAATGTVLAMLHSTVDA